MPGLSLVNIIFTNWSERRRNFQPLRSFLDIKIKITKIISHRTRSLFICGIRPFNYDSKDRMKRCETKDEMSKNSLLLKVEGYFHPVESSCSSPATPAKNFVKQTSRGRSFWSTTDKTTAQHIETTNCNYLEEASPLMISARTEKSTTTTRIITSRPKKLLGESYLQQRSETSVAESLTTADLITRMTEENQKLPEGTLKNAEAKSRPLVHYRFEYQLSRKQPPG